MNNFDQRMDTLKAGFAKRAVADQGGLRDAWAVRDDATITRIAHNLSGTAGIFGYAELSNAARELEEALHRSDSDEILRQKLEVVLAQIQVGWDG